MKRLNLKLGVEIFTMSMIPNHDDLPPMTPKTQIKDWRTLMFANNLHNLRALFTACVFGLLLGGCNDGSVSSFSTQRNSVSTTVSLSATPSIVTYNSTTVLSWSSSNSTSCSSSPAGVSGTSGSLTTPALTANTTYTVTCDGPTGKASKRVDLIVTGGSIVNAANACANAAPLGGAVYYYCDCGAGAQAGCVPGIDTNPGTINAPRRTLGNAATLFKTLAVNDTVALCKGGVFTTGSIFNMGTGKCTAGNACNDLRDYTPTFAGTAKPIINREDVDAPLFNFTGNKVVSSVTLAGGLRILNLKLQATPGARNAAISLFRGARDVTMCNLDIDAFNIAVYNESSDGITENIKLTGSLITNSIGSGYLGGGNNNEISYNYWLNNGGNRTGTHALYFASSVEISNVRAIGNYIKGQNGPTCLNVPFVGHFAVDGFQVRDNVVDIAASETSGGCWGIALNNLTGNPAAVFMKNTVISGNTIINGGNLALTVSGCPDCVIENNVIINETAMSGTGIGVTTLAKRANTGDLVNDRNIIRNNTIWYGPNANVGGPGINVGIEGSGHIIHNNTVTYSAAVSNGRFNCFDYPLPTASYAFINNNHCYVPLRLSNWETRGDTFATWQARGFDTFSIFGIDPKFTAAGSNFKPATGSPLIGAGITANGGTNTYIGAIAP